MSEKKEELVAVMLPRETVEHYVRAGYIDSPSRTVKAACKRALRPDPPSCHYVADLREHAQGRRAIETTCATKLSDWIEYVLEHGWEPEK